MDAEAGVVHEPGDESAAGGGGDVEPLGGARLGKIDRRHVDFTAVLGAEFRGQRGELRLIASREHQRPAIGREQLGELQSNAARSAGDDRAARKQGLGHATLEGCRLGIWPVEDFDGEIKQGAKRTVRESSPDKLATAFY